MNLTKIGFFLGVLSTLVVKTIHKDSVCSSNKYVIVDEKGLKKCQLCPNCPPGFGLEPRCGSTLTKTESLDIDCKPCVRGKTYSEEHGPSSCKSCAICAPKEVVWKKCTEEKNANCSGTCVKDYYFDSHTHDCQPCSYCCGDKNDVIVKECVDHGMPKNKRCNILRRLQCTPQNATTTPTQHERNEPNNLKVILGGVFGSLVFIAIVILAFIIWYRRCYRQNNNEERGENIEMNPMIESKEKYACESCDALSKIKTVKVQIDLPQDVKAQIDFNCVEGESVRIRCHVEDEQNHEILNGNFLYTWSKDGEKLENEHSKILTFDKLKVSDFGRFRFQVECQDHAGDQAGILGSNEVFLDVKPRPGNTYKMLKALRNQEVYDDVITQIGLAGIWKHVAMEYGLTESQIEKFKLLEKNDNLKAVQETFNTVQRFRSDLTVYEFVKFLKGKEQKIVKMLEPHLTCSKHNILNQDVRIQIELPQNCVEGETVRVQCHLEDEQNHEILNDNFAYTWSKDGRKLENEHSKILTFDKLKVSDFGRLKCQVECQDHAGGQATIESNEVFLDVKPGPEKTYKMLEALRNQNVYDNVITQIGLDASYGNKLWKQVAVKYGLNDNQIANIKLLETNDTFGAVSAAFDAVQTLRPDLTVYEFCTFMKEKGQNEIVEMLKPHLTCPHQSSVR